jgi:hypothetical protein
MIFRLNITQWKVAVDELILSNFELVITVKYYNVY